MVLILLIEVITGFSSSERSKSLSGQIDQPFQNGSRPTLHSSSEDILWGMAPKADGPPNPLLGRLENKSVDANGSGVFRQPQPGPDHFSPVLHD